MLPIPMAHRVRWRLNLSLEPSGARGPVQKVHCGYLCAQRRFETSQPSSVTGVRWSESSDAEAERG